MESSNTSTSFWISAPTSSSMVTSGAVDSLEAHDHELSSSPTMLRLLSHYHYLDEFLLSHERLIEPLLLRFRRLHCDRRFQVRRRSKILARNIYSSIAKLKGRQGVPLKDTNIWISRRTLLDGGFHNNSSFASSFREEVADTRLN